VSTDTHFFLALGAMALAAYACRIAGYLLMGYVRITPRVEGALKAMPLGVMIGLVTPAIAAGKLPEMLALVVVVVVMKITGKDIAAALAGAATVALARWVLAA
jgi:uncharacterized membrane protein